MCVVSTGIAYADRKVEEHGDYRMLGLLRFSDLTLDMHPKCPKDIEQWIKSKAAKIQAMKGQEYPVSSSGQTITLGHALS